MRFLPLPHLTGSQEGLDHAALLGDPQVDQGQDGEDQVLIMHLGCVPGGGAQQLVQGRVLKHEAMLHSILLLRHFLGAVPHAGEASAYLPRCGGNAARKVQHVRRGATVQQMIREGGPRRQLVVSDIFSREGGGRDQVLLLLVHTAEKPHRPDNTPTHARLSWPRPPGVCILLTGRLE